MATGFMIVLLALLATAVARPEPQFIYSAGPYYGTALSAAYTAPAAPVAPVVPAAIPAPALPIPTYPGYPGIYPYSVSAYSYGYESTYAELPAVNPSTSLVYNSAYRSLPYSSLQYSNLPYTYAPSAAFTYLR